MKTNTHLLSYLAHFSLKLEMFQIKLVEKIKTHILHLMSFLNRAPVIQPDRPRLTILPIHIVYWTTKGRNTHSGYVTIFVFALQKWLHDRALMLPNTKITLLVLL